MDENDKLIALFSTRVRQLLLLVEKLRKENKALSDEVALRDKSLAEMGYELAQARNDYNSLMMAKMIEITDGDMESAQRRLAKLIREVNKLSLIHI